MPLTRDVIDEVRLLLVQWFLFCHIEVLGADIVRLKDVLQSELWRRSVDELGCGFAGTYVETGGDGDTRDIVVWFSTNADTLGISTKERRPRKGRNNSSGSADSYVDLPRDNSGPPGARVLKLSNDNAGERLWDPDLFGSAAIAAKPMLRHMKFVRAETANTRQTMIASIYEIVNGSLPFSFLERACSSDPSSDLL